MFSKSVIPLPSHAPFGGTEYCTPTCLPLVPSSECLMGADLEQAHHSHYGSWVLKDDAKEKHGNRKIGYTGTEPGDKIVSDLGTMLVANIIGLL